jgi:two-component system phosphate regulon sensor histidine kinase PhoR
MWRSRMFWRQFGTQAVLLLAAIGLIGLVVVRHVDAHYRQETEENLRARALVIAELVRDCPEEEMSRLQERLAALRDKVATRITLLAEDGRVLADTDAEAARMENHVYRPELQAARAGSFATSTRHSNTTGQEMMYGTLRTRSNGQAVAYVRIAVPLTRIEAERNALHRLVWTTAAFTALAALFLTVWLARRVTLPLQELTQAADHIAAGGYGRTVYAVGRDEIGQLAQTFNHMSERLAVQFAQLQEDRQQLRTILGAMVEGVIALDAEQRILFANDCAGELLDFQPHAVVGRRLWEVVRNRALHELVQRALNSPEPCQQELSWKGPGKRSLTVHAARLPGPAGRGAILVLHDTTELRRLERLRQEFVANVSHELKTPLSVIKVCTETLIDGAADDSEHRGRFLDRISEQADRLHALILDLLSLARIESGAEVFEFKAVSLAPLVSACLERHQGRAQARKQVLQAANGESPPAGSPNGLPSDLAVWADEEAVSQILDNLIDNALKYTPENGRISVRWRPEDGQVCLEVEDTGIGIPEHDLPRIFERFYRVDKARSREMGGTGLGLSIVKHLVQAMHGSVRASSRVGQGTTFHITLPRASENGSEDAGPV